MRVAVVGAGGCAREVAWTIAETPGFDLVGYAVTSPGSPGATDHLSTPLWPVEAIVDSIDGFVLGIGNPAVRNRVAGSLRAAYPQKLWPSVIHPRATVGTGCEIGLGVVICVNATVTVNVRVEDDVLIHYNCTLSHESQVGGNSVLNPGASLSGGVVLGRDVLIGAGAQVLQYLRVGDGAIVGAGAVVTRNVAAGSTVAGVPARAIRTSPRQE